MTNKNVEDNPTDQEQISADAPKDKTGDELAQLQTALEEAKAKADENWEKLLRKEAEFQNFRKRAETDVANARKFGIEKFASELLAVIDSFEQAKSIEINEDTKATSIMEGMDLTHKVLLDVLHKFGIEVLDPTGEAFNPQFHEAMSMQETADAKPNEVIMVMQKGFMLQDRVLRPARVIVAKAPSKAPAAE